MTRSFTLLAAFLALLAVLAGTFGAHGLDGRLSENDAGIWETAARYHMYHALALLAVAWARERFGSKCVAAAGWLFVVGISVFAGTLYLLATSELAFGTRQSWLGMITPIGGMCFIFGWACLFVGVFKSK